MNATQRREIVATASLDMGPALAVGGSVLERALRGELTVSEAAAQAEGEAERRTLDNILNSGPLCKLCSVVMDYAGGALLEGRAGRQIAVPASWICHECGTWEDI